MSLTNPVHKETELAGRAGAVSPHPSPLTAGSVLQSRYRIIKQLGKGGMGAVYEAVDERLDATVALKETFSIDDRLRRQFEQEARLFAQLSHPALPRVSDYFTEGERAFLVMQFISGVDLAEIIAKQPGPFPRNQVVAWADQLLDALIFLHTRERQIIHRDIKPHNLKLTPTGTIALLDFGLAKAQSADRSARDNSICGYTRRYAPLEQIQDQGTTPQSDIYALGATLYHLLTGIKPADAVVREAALVDSMPDPLRPANEVHPAVGKEVSDILARAMAQNPADRYASASDFREALARLGRSRERVAEHANHTSSTQSPKAVANDRTFSKSERMHAADPFDGYSILKPEEPGWFMPRSGNRPNLMVAGIIVLLTGLICTFYGYRRWSQSWPATQVRTNNSQPAPAAAGSQNRPRLSTTNDVGATSAPVGDLGSESAAAARNDADAKIAGKARPAFRIDGGNSNVPTVRPALREQSSTIVPSVNVPNTRLPRADLRENDPALSFPRLPAYSQPEIVTERQVLRTPDGTQVVKFSDGTTRVFRPGEKIVSGNVPQ